MPIDLKDTGLEAAFTLESEKGGIIEDVPFRILVFADLSGNRERPALDKRKPVEIDRDNFDDIFARISPGLDLDLGNGQMLPLGFSALEDLHPDGLFRNVSAFSYLRGLRKRLKDGDTFNATAREARQLFGIAPQQTAGEPAAENSDEEGDGLLDSILARPEGGSTAPRGTVAGDLGRLVSDLVRPHLVSFDENEQAGLIGAADTAVSLLMRQILSSSAFRELEAAWRSLFFLVRRVPTSAQLKIFVVDASKEELAADLKNAESLSASNLYRMVLRDAVETQGGEPWALICGGYAYSANVDDIAALMRISSIAAAAKAPYISHLRPEVLGIHSFAASPEPREWKPDPASNETKLWTALRGQADSKYLGMVTPRFLARLPYGADSDPVDSFEFEEFDEVPKHDEFLWANGAFLAAALLGLSFSEYEWEMDRRMIQDIDGLPVHIHKAGGETIFKPCAEILMTDAGVDRLMENGFMPLISYRSTDRVKLGRFQSVAEPTTGLKGRWSKE